MSSLRNRFEFDGNLCRDPVLSQTSKGTPKCFYTVASSRYQVVGGEKVQGTDYLPVVSYGKQAENDHKYLKRGYGVTVSGSIRSWFDSEARRGGFNFDVDEVIYRGRPVGGDHPSAVPDVEDEWVRAYESVQEGHPANTKSAFGGKS